MKQEPAVSASGPGSHTLLGAAILGSGATVIVGLLGVLRTKVLALELDPAGLGLYGQSLALLTALSAASGLGLGLGTTRVVAETRTRNDSQGLRSALEVSFALPLMFGCALALALAGASGLLAPLLLDDDRALLIVLAALAVPIVAIQGPMAHALQGFRDVAGAQGANVFFGLVLTVASIAGVLLADLEGALVALAVGNLGYAAALGWRLRGLVHEAGVSLTPRAGLSRERLRDPLVRGMLAIGFASLFVGVGATLSELAARTLVIHEEDAAAAGIFQALQVVSVQILGVIVASVVFLSFTAITEAHAARDQDGVRKAIDDTLRLTLILLLPVLLAFGLFREWGVDLLFSAEFARAEELLPLQLSGDVLRTIAWVLGSALVPVGLTREWVALTTATVLGYVVATFVLVQVSGLDGAVVAYVIQWALAAVGTAWVLRSRDLLALSPLTLRTLGLAALVTALVLTVPSPSLLFAAGITIVVSLAVLMLATGADERAALAGRIRSMLRRPA